MRLRRYWTRTAPCGIGGASLCLVPLLLIAGCTTAPVARCGADLGMLREIVPPKVQSPTNGDMARVLRDLSDQVLADNQRKAMLRAQMTHCL